MEILLFLNLHQNVLLKYILMTIIWTEINKEYCNELKKKIDRDVLKIGFRLLEFFVTYSWRCSIPTRFLKKSILCYSIFMRVDS